MNITSVNDIDEAVALYCDMIDKPGGSEFANSVGLGQERYLIQAGDDDLDGAFVKAVNLTLAKVRAAETAGV